MVTACFFFSKNMHEETLLFMSADVKEGTAGYARMWNRWRTSTRVEDTDNYVVSVLQMYLGGWSFHLQMQAEAHEIPAPSCMDLQHSAPEY
jgi:hypothetical protein